MPNDWNTQVITEFRANSGQVGGNFESMPLVLVTTTGAKSGLPRINPVAYQADAANPDRVFIFASKAGATTDPDWYRNLVANPTVTVERGAETYEATASEVKGDERDRIWATQVQNFPGFGEYEKTANRVIPVIALTRN